MFKGYRFAAVLVMGGQGLRFGGDIPKQYHWMAGKKLYLHTLDAFLKAGFFDEIVIVCHEDWVKRVEEDVKDFFNVSVVKGGETRRDSSYAGLRAIKKADYVQIHDAVRPFISEEIILKNAEMVIEHRAVDTCVKSSDTIVYVENGIIAEVPKRDNCLRGQTPQSFEYGLIKRAHEEVKEPVTDDCGLVAKLGVPIYVVEADDFNIKVTNKLDLFLAEQIFYLRSKKTAAPASSIEGKRYALVGASGGIGKAIQELLENEKALIIPISRSSKYRADLQDYKSVKEVFEKIFLEFGEIDGLINSAGFLSLKPLSLMEKDEIDATIDVNLKGLIYACKLSKIKRGGHIINLTSSSFSRGRKLQGVYSSTKAAVVNFTQSLAEELDYLKINAIAPQRTDTSLRRSNFPGEDPKSLLNPKEVAKAVLELLKDQITTGAIIEVRRK